MMQNLSGIEPVKTGRCDDMPLDLSGRTVKVDGFAPLPDPVVAERFQSAIADGCGGVSVSMKPPQKPAIEFDCRHEDASPCREDSCPDVAQTLSGSGKAEIGGGKSRVERVGDVAVEGVKDGIAVSEKPNQSLGEGSERRWEDAPPYQEAIVPQTTSHSQGVAIPQNVASLPKKAVPQNASLPQRKPESQSVHSHTTHSEAPVSVLKDAIPVQRMHHITQNSSTVPDLGVADVKGIVSSKPPQNMEATPEHVQIIAPAPLPIELPAAAVLKQTAPAAPAEVTRMFVAAAEAVADAVLVSSGFVNGEGRMLVRLQPEVLGGSEVQIVAKGGTLTVVVNPATQDVQTIVEANRTQFEQHLAEKVHSWRISVAVRRGVKTDERV